VWVLIFADSAKTSDLKDRLKEKGLETQNKAKGDFFCSFFFISFQIVNLFSAKGCSLFSIHSKVENDKCNCFAMPAGGL
jgi:hypothetical protein